jgi:hypothetical protein
MKFLIFPTVLFLLVITACRGTFDIGLEHAPSPTNTVPVAPSATPTSAPISATPQPTVIAIPTTANLIMLPGTTAVVAQGTLQPGEAVTYTLQAKQSQPMILMMGSQNNDITLGVFAPQGKMLLDPASKRTRWQGLLPETGVYAIRVVGGATQEDYTLTAKVAQVVNFAPGATAITLNGTTAKGYVFSYAMSCQALQTMAASLNVPSSRAYIDVFGVSSGSLLSSSEKANAWTGVLPQTQTCVIEVIPNNGQVVDYSLKVSLTPGAWNIVMPSGATAVVEQGSVKPGQVVTYTLQAAQSQPMILMLNSQNRDVTLGMVTPNGSLLIDPANKWTNWQEQLPETGIYTIQVIGGATEEDYTLTAKVAQVVSLAPGTTSITLNGTTAYGYVFSYAVSCQANQTLSASLNIPSSTAYIDVFGLSSGGALLSATAKANTWTGVLPQTQTYVIEVIPNNGQVVDYALTVSVH